MFFDARDAIVREAQMQDRRDQNAVQAQLKSTTSEPHAALAKNKQTSSKHAHGPIWTFQRLRLRRNSQS